MIEGDAWDRLDTLLKAALERPPGQRDRWLDEACASDVGLRRQLADLLRLAEEEHEQWQPGGARDRLLGGSTSGTLDAQAERAALVPGQRLGRYEVLDLLGAGGMGHVYRALDPSLGREVAIKALAYAFHGDSSSLRRFEREARVLAALSHPNIATIYGFERLDGAPFLILERVEGQTLAERLARGAMPTREALPVALQIAEGLEEAHGKGVIHRDLKPSNVMLTPEGRVKLVDFGLAKTAAPRDAGASVAPTTATGAILGTAAYMSPEQVNGVDVDARTDVWAFGCLLYEMLSGTAAFPGRSVPEVLAAVLRDEPNWRALPPDVPANVSRLLRRCLRKDPLARVQHIGDVRLELNEPEAEAAPPISARAGSRSRRVLPWLVAATAAGAAGTVLLRPSVQPAGAGVVRLSLELPGPAAIPAGYTAPFAVAPAGSHIVVEGEEDGTTRLYLRSLDDVTTRVLPGTEGGRQPFFSPDGRWVGFFADRKLKKVPVDGGPVLTLAELGDNTRGAAWAAGGTVVVAASQTSGLVRVSEQGGRPVPLTTLEIARGEYSHRWPEALPGGKWIIFTAGLEDASFDEARLEAVSLETGERRAVLEGAGFGRYLPGGVLAFARGGRLHGVAFDADRVEVRGTSKLLLDAVRYDPRNGGCHFAVSASGTLVYGPGVPTSPDHYLSWVDRNGRLERAVDRPRPFRDLRLSPDGRQVAVAVGAAADSDLWLLDANATLSRLSFGLSPHRPSWTPDGRGITVGAPKGGVWRLLTLPADGRGEPVVLLESAERMYPNDWSPDGRHLVFQQNNATGGWDLETLRIDDAGRPVGEPSPLSATPFREASAVIAPDGHWVAYESDEVDGLVQVYVRSFPDGGHKVRVSNGGARWPAWGRAGELYYWHTGQHQVHVARTRHEGGRFVTSAIEPVWGSAPPARVLVTVAGARFDVHPSGGRFLMLETAAPSVEPPLTRPVVILGWKNVLESRKLPPL